VRRGFGFALFSFVSRLLLGFLARTRLLRSLLMGRLRRLLLLLQFLQAL
jgi:hypothetical protein